ncbi:MAG: hypothetical protein A2017_08445 [Lentisphaerae bacterium GWF2_44_16]|nr:MAG: hypothetical protein A2017_08445 [Lentisphaerae bacterium GWF2_44_16]
MPGETEKTLSVIIPVYNEEKTLLTMLRKVRDARLSLKKEVIIVNDGSTDTSPEIIRKWLEEHPPTERVNFKFFSKENGGKGSAVKEGLKHSSGDIVIIQDADLEYDPEDYQACVDPILKGECKVVYGSRELQKERREYSYLSFFLGGLMVSTFMNLLYGSELSDEPTCYKTFDGNLIRALLFKGNGFEWEPEITSKLLRLGYEIREVPISYKPRKINEGKKINWKDGIKALWTALLWRFRPMRKEKRKLDAFPSEKTFISLRAVERQTFLLIVFLCLSVRLLIIIPGMVDPENSFVRPDSESYVLPAMSLALNGDYNKSPVSEEPATLRPPGFSIFLASIFALNDCGLKLPVLIFCFLGAAILIPVYYTGRLFGGFATGSLAALLFGLNITGIALTPLYLSDTLFTFFSAMQLYFFARFYFRPCLIYPCISILFAGAAVLIRPVGLLWIVPCVFLIMIHGGISFRSKFAVSAVCVFIFLGIIFPWMYRNECVGAGFAIDTNSGNMLYHNGAVLLGKAENKSPEEIRQQMMKESEEEFAANPGKYSNEADKEKYKLGKLKALILKHPLLYLRLHFRPSILIPDLATFCELCGFTKTGQGTFDVLNRQGIIAAVKHYFSGQLWLLFLLSPALLIVLVTYIGCLWEFLLWLIKGKWYLVFFFLAFVEYYLLLPGPVTMPRYHLPALPFICVAAALVLSKYSKRLFRKS